jgi:transposase
MDKDTIIAKLLEENRLLREQIRLLEKKIVLLEEKIAQLEKNSGNSSKPPSSDIVKPPKILRRMGRKRRRGGQPGHPKFSRQPFAPDEVDEIVEYELCVKDAVGLHPLDEWFVLQQIELPAKRYRVIEHRARKYLDPATGVIHITPLPERIRKGSLLGADMTAVTAFMKGACHMSYTTIQQFFKTVMNLDLSRSLLCKATQKVSGALQPAYEQLTRHLPQVSPVGADETGHHNNGDLHWTWCFDTAQFSVFRIDKSRGSQVPKMMLGKDFSGIVGADYWGAYRKYVRLFGIKIQYCMAHLIREVRFLAEHSVKNLSSWGNGLLVWLKKLFATLHRQSRYTPAGFRRAMERLKQGFLSRVRRPPKHKLARKLAKRFRGRVAEDYFRFLDEPGVEPTNNGTERQIRTVVIDRRITQGTRSDAGMRWSERIWTTLATCKKQNRNGFEFICQSLLAHWNQSCYPLLL